MKKNYEIRINNNNKYQDIKINHVRQLQAYFTTNGNNIILKDTRHNKRVILPYDYAQRGVKEITLKYLKQERKIKIDSFTCVEGNKTIIYFNTLDFATQIK